MGLLRLVAIVAWTAASTQGPGRPLFARAELAADHRGDSGGDLDDECAADGGGGLGVGEREGAAAGGCAVSALQRAARRARGARGRLRRVARHPGLDLASSFFVGSGTSPVVTCAAREVDSAEGGEDGAPRAALYSSFGAGGGGAVWRFSGLVVLDGPPMDAVDLDEGVRLTLGLAAQSASWELSPYTVNVQGLREAVATPLDFKAEGTSECPPGYCLIPQPRGGGLLEQISQPDCGFLQPAEHTLSVPGPDAGQKKDLEIDITELTASNYTSFKVWASPTSLKQGMWQVPRLTVTSWGFNFAPPMSSVD